MVKYVFCYRAAKLQIFDEMTKEKVKKEETNYFCSWFIIPS